MAAARGRLDSSLQFQNDLYTVGSTQGGQTKINQTSSHVILFEKGETAPPTTPPPTAHSHRSGLAAPGSGATSRRTA